MAPTQLVDVMVIAAAGKGTVITVVNWSNETLVKGMNLVLQFDCEFKAATLASGGRVKVCLLLIS